MNPMSKSSFHNSTHHVRRFNDDSNPQRTQRLADRFGDVFRHTFLNLKAARENFHDSRQLAEPNYFFVRQITDRNAPEKGDHVMLAHRKHFYVLDDYHLVVILVENCLVNHL